jgi:6-pyruvoyltetrahydropterin/6-carboxytetrahydropterin synthase
MTNESTLYFTHGKLKFSAGHFTIFSETEREPLHGHNYTLEVMVTAGMGEPGITFDYRLFEEKLMQLCLQLNWRFLVPTQSPYVVVKDDGEHYEIVFNQKSTWLLKEDVVLLPLENVTLEALSQWFINQLNEDHAFMAAFKIKKMAIKVFNGPYHAAEAAMNCHSHCG